MSVLTLLVNLLTINIESTLISLLIGFVVYKLTKFYAQVFSLPPGPIPLPFLGNALYFRGTKNHWTIEMEKMADKYGPVFTMWMGSFPLVIMTDIDIAKEAFKKSDFAGRPKSVFHDVFMNETSRDVAFSDYGHHWMAIRRVVYMASKNFSKMDKLCYLISDCVDHTINTIIQKEGINKPFVPFEYICYTCLNINGAITFGARYELDDPEYRKLRYNSFDIYDKEINLTFLMWEMFPILRKFDKRYKKLENIFKENFKDFKNKLQSHYKDYDESNIRDFCDTLISAKIDAIREDKESAPHLTDDNLSWALINLFIASIRETQTTLNWLLLLITYYPKVLEKLRTEIITEIGDRMATHEDRERCHYVMAVISETMRYRTILPTGLNHKGVVTSKIGNYTIPKGTQIAVFQSYIMSKEEYWPNANEFIPERFLQNGKYSTTGLKAFIPFGVGRRVCAGEKLAFTDLFLILVRFIQKTSKYNLTLDYCSDTEGDPNITLELVPKEYKITLNK